MIDNIGLHTSNTLLANWLRRRTKSPRDVPVRNVLHKDIFVC